MKNLWPSHPTRVLHTFGTDFEIGQQHAEAMGPLVAKGMVGFYGDFWAKLLSNRPKSFPKKLIVSALQKCVDPGLVNILVKQLPSDSKNRILGLSEASKISFEKLVIPLVLPDLLPLLQAYGGKLGAVNFIDVSPPPLFGCSSFIHNGNKFLQGRNLDFPGVGYWDRYPVIQMMAPKNTLRYIGFVTAGVPIAGITGVNEAQISVALHQHYCFNTNLKGKLPFVIGEDILRNARNLNEALEILKNSKVASAWAFVVADGKTRRAFIYECHSNAAGIRWLDENNPTLTHSNYFQTKEPSKKEYATTERMTWDNYSRANRMKEKIAEYGSAFDIAEAVKTLSDHWDPYWQREKIMNRTVSQLYNVQSVVWDLENMKAYFAEGDSPIHLGNYQEYDMGAIFDGKNGKTENNFEGYRFQNPKLQKAKEHFIYSFIHCFEGNVDGAQKELTNTLSFEDFAEARLVKGLLQMKEGFYEKAAEMFLTAKTHIEKEKASSGRSYFPPEYFEAWLYWARSLDLQGKRIEAVKQYSQISKHQDLLDKNIKKIVLQKKCYKKQRLDRIIMPYSSYIPFS